MFVNLYEGKKKKREKNKKRTSMDTQYQMYGQQEMSVPIHVNRNKTHRCANNFLRKVSLNKLKGYSRFLEKRHNRPTHITWSTLTL